VTTENTKNRSAFSGPIFSPGCNSMTIRRSERTCGEESLPTPERAYFNKFLVLACVLKSVNEGLGSSQYLGEV
jgi:hypothetical protein